MSSSSDTRSTSSVYMPEDLLTQILLKCPSKSIIRFQAVCKSWRSLIRSKLFNAIYNHLHSSSNPSWSANYLVVKNKQLSLYHASGCGAPRRFSYPCPYKDRIDLVGSAYGAVILDVKDGLIVWNPFNNKHTKIHIKLKRIPYVCGMELDFDPYSNKCWGFKVIILKRAYRHYNSAVYNATVYRLYTTRSVSQKEVQCNISKEITFQQCRYGNPNNDKTINLNQACHWSAYRNTDFTSMIIAFDFKSEKFTEILLPFKSWGFSMIAYKGMLCIGFFQVEESLVQGILVPFHVYVMKEYGVMESWASLFVIDTDPGFLPHLIGVTGHGDVLIHIKKKKGQRRRDIVVSCNPHTQPMTLSDEKFDLFGEPEVCYGQSPLLF